jgi:hypothetical protein
VAHRPSLLSRGTCDGRHCRVRAKRDGAEGAACPGNVTVKSLGKPAWPRSLLGLVRDPPAWLSEYHQRSEATWWSIEARNPGKIRKWLAERRATEALLRAVVRNLRRPCYLRWLERNPTFTAPASIAS